MHFILCHYFFSFGWKSVLLILFRIPVIPLRLLREHIHLIFTVKYRVDFLLTNFSFYLQVCTTVGTRMLGLHGQWVLLIGDRSKIQVIDEIIKDKSLSSTIVEQF